MLFSEASFVHLFLPVLLLVHWIVPGRARNLVLVGASLGFYALGEKHYVALMLGSIVLNFWIGRLLAPVRRGRQRQVLVTFGIVGNLGILVAFKYADFIVETLNRALPWLGLSEVPSPGMHLPIGISFFTFQSISYIIDAYRRDVVPGRSLTNVALYISMFPQLIAGPIVRYQEIAGRLVHRAVTSARMAYGCRRFIMGLAKKVIIANALAYPVDQIFGLPSGEVGASLAWFAALCYTLQIYFDFSGYSDMAIGLGQMFGFRFPENFNYPYVAQSITEFWNRWHMSLSRWLRDYLYIPMGGNRGSKASVYRNLLVVFLLCGVWHGAAWTFVLWGAYQGLFLVIERVWFRESLGSVPRLVSQLYTMLVVIFGWVLFRAESLPQAGEFMLAMAGITDVDQLVRPVSHYLTPKLAVVISIGTVLSLRVAPRALEYYRNCLEMLEERSRARLELVTSWLGVAGIIGLALCSLVFVGADSYSPFIYFRF